ncbi:PREDICTED: olfactory receptor 1496-like [Nanorana parkeri]|uniref:olfactory receptor 1496-like n=1 Tax=Nanorana parkeri TaxID=125878 RepID=UPI0008541EFE|nr:PREDICTED: olfactory receptor 1496-like [Nanorana parkeri]
MGEKNMTVTTVILFEGFHIPEKNTFLVFLLFLIIYCITLCGNLLIITLVSYSKTLQSPMYFFLAQLAVSDILLTTDVLPNTLHAALVENTMIVSISDCIAQFYFFAATETLECLLLTVMSYDRYLAICKPLHYTLLMNHQLCWIMIIICWTLSFVTEFVHTLTVSKLQFCNSNVIDHFFCDLDPILQLSCSDTSIAQLEATVLSVVFAIIPFFVIIVSYVYIIVTIFEIPSITGRQKVFSTCSSHLTVVSIFYGTIVCVYLVPSRGQSWNITKYLSLLYTVVIPLLNPIIYSLRNKDLKKVAGKTIRKFF